MDRWLTQNADAVRLLQELEQEEFTVNLTSERHLVVAPRSRLTSDRMKLIAVHKDSLRLALVCRDSGVVNRVCAFTRQADALPAPRVPAFLFSPDVPYVKGRCFSCGDLLLEFRYSRCWRCSVAWRIVCRLPIPEALLDDNATARVTP